MTYAPADFLDLRGLSLRQPYADLMALDAKRVETRGRDIGAQPGQVVAIHASLSAYTYDEAPAAWEVMQERAKTLIVRGGVILCVGRVASVWKMRGDSLAGADGAVCLRGDIKSLIAAVDGRWWIEQRCGGYGKGRHLIVFRDVVRLVQPVACRGSLGLWRVPDDARDAVRVQVAA